MLFRGFFYPSSALPHPRVLESDQNPHLVAFETKRHTNMSSKRDPNNPIEASRITFTIKGGMTRCTFLAGFAYYELGRNDFQASSDPAYVVLMTAAFAFAVVAVGMGTLILYFLERCKNGEQKKSFVARVNSIYVRGCFRLFLCALLLYVLALGRCGFVYYASNTAAKYAVLATSLLVVPLFFWGLTVIAGTQLSLQHNEGFTDHELLDATIVVETASGENTVVESGGVVLEDLHMAMIRQADTIASRAVYITGFCQSGVTRFIDTDNPLRHVYLACIIFAYVAAALPAFLLAIEAIFINDTVEGAQTAIAVLLKPLHNILAKCYSASFVGLSLALAHMGWGCGYADKSWVPLHCGLLAFAMIIFGSICVRRNKDYILQVAAVAIHEESEAIHEESEAQHKDTCDQVAVILSLINNTGSQATISSGFIWYTVVTYATDVAPSTFTGDLGKLVFLELSAITLAMGLIAAVYDSVVSFAVLNLKPGRQQLQFLERSEPLVKICIMSYQVSMLCFLANFAMLGNVKFSEESFVPLGIASFAFVLLVAGWFLVNRWRRLAEEVTSATSSSSSSSDVQQVVPSDAEEQITEKLATQDLASGRALFFGGFAYFALLFFTPRGRIHFVDEFYPIAMSFAFALSAVVVIWSGVVDINSRECRSVRARFDFIKRADTLFTVHKGLSLMAIFSFVAGFSVIGWVKSTSNEFPNSNNSPIMAIGTALLVVCIVPALMRLRAAYIEAQFGNDVSAPAATADNASEMVDYKKFLLQIDNNASQTSFIAGNVFYEILFAEAHGALALNYLYFIASTLTFITGVGAVATAGVIKFASMALVSDRQRRNFAAWLKRLYVKQVLFGLNIICTFAWLVSLSVFGVKYQKLHHLWEPGFSFSIVSILTLAWSFFSLHNTSNDIMGK